MTDLTRPLRLRPFRRLLFAYCVNALGTWLGEIALAVLVLRETGSPGAVAAVWVMGQFAPSLVVPILVARIEPLPAGRSLPALLAAEAAIFAGLAATFDDVPVAAVLCLVALDGALGLTARALVKASLVATTRPEGMLREGNALLVGAFSGCMAVGPFAAGALVAALSPSTALVADAASFGVAALALGLRAELPHGNGVEPSLGARLRAGLAHVRHHTALRQLLLCIAVVAGFAAAIIPVEVVFVIDTLGGNEAAYGTVLGLWGVGALAGGAIVPLLRSAPPGRLLIASFVVVAVSYIGIGSANSLALVGVFSLFGGMANGIEAFAAMTAVQEQTAERYQTRVAGLAEALMASATGAGFALGGALAAAGSPRAVYYTAGIGILLAVFLIGGPPLRGARPVGPPLRGSIG